MQATARDPEVKEIAVLFLGDLNMEVLLTLLGAIAFLPLLIAISTLLNGWALHLLWAWFVAPVFAGAPALTIGGRSA